MIAHPFIIFNLSLDTLTSVNDNIINYVFVMICFGFRFHLFLAFYFVIWLSLVPGFVMCFLVSCVTFLLVYWFVFRCQVISLRVCVCVCIPHVYPSCFRCPLSSCDVTYWWVFLFMPIVSRLYQAIVKPVHLPNSGHTVCYSVYNIFKQLINVRIAINHNNTF